MSAVAAPRPPSSLAMPRYSSAPPSWVGDPSILVFAVRYALGVRGGHVPEFVHQAIETNALTLTGAARRLIVRDVRAWLAYDGAEAAPADRAVWIAVLAALGVDA